MRITRFTLAALAVAAAGCKAPAQLASPGAASSVLRSRPEPVSMNQGPPSIPPPQRPLLDFEQIEHRQPPRGASVRSALRPAGFIAGKIVDPAGRALSDVTIIVTAPGAANEPPRRVTVDGRGWFRIDALSPGQRYLLVVTAFRGETTYLARASVLAPRDRILITAEPAGSLPARTPSTAQPKSSVNQTSRSAGLAGVGLPAPARQPAPAPRPGNRQQGSSLREFVQQLFGRQSANPTMAAPRASQSQRQKGANAEQPPRRPFAELPLPGLRSSSDPAVGASKIRSPTADKPPGVASSTSTPRWRPVQRPATGGGPANNAARMQPVSPARRSAVASTKVSRRPVRRPSQPSSPLRQRAPAKRQRTAYLAQVAGGTLLNYALPDSRLQTVALDGLDGQLLLVDFWASWCGACLRAMPAIESLHRDFYGRGLRVVGIAYEQGPLEQQAATVAEVARRLQTTYPLLLGSADQQDRLRRAFGVRVFPTLVLLDRSGNMLWRSDGFNPSEFQRLRAILERRLAGR